jgi:prepilin-type N-terminal cleavage/methylation domain-containing protein
MSKFCLSKKGFGLLEVMAAAVVLGFLIVGLTQLQKGNRESILRVRARDAANFIAQHVLDSISAGGVKSLDKSCLMTPPVVYEDNDYKYIFEGKNTGKIETKYKVKVSCIPNMYVASEDVSDYILSQGKNGKDTISRSIEAEVSWLHKQSTQSIRMAKVVR